MYVLLPLYKILSITDKCESMSCDHFCIHTPERGRCMCKEGYELKDENGTCEGQLSAFLLIL